jgi:hypothetical protein
VPVDSGKRSTLESLSAVEWLAKTDAPALSLKAFFDIEVDVEGEKGFVLLTCFPVD